MQKTGVFTGENAVYARPPHGDDLMAVALLNSPVPVSIRVRQEPMTVRVTARPRVGNTASVIARLAYAFVRDHLGSLGSLLTLTRVLRQPRPAGIREEERWW